MSSTAHAERVVGAVVGVDGPDALRDLRLRRFGSVARRARRLWRKFRIEVNSGAGATTPLACCATANGACSWTSRSASCDCIPDTAASTDPAPTRTRTGSVFMNGPGTRSAPAPAFIRPNSTVPKTTSSRPDTDASTRAHATWNNVARTPRAARACSRTRPDSSRPARRPAAAAARRRARRADRTARSSRSRRPAARRRTGCAPRARRRVGRAHEVPEGQRRGSRSPSPRRIAAISSRTTSQPVWSCCMWCICSSASHRPVPGLLGHETPGSAVRGPGPCAAAGGRAAAAAGHRPDSHAGRDSLGRPAGPPDAHTTWTGSAQAFPDDAVR